MQSINVLGHEYTVEFETQDNVSGEGADGVIQFSNQRIVIRDNMPERHQQVVLLHEVIHAIFETTGHNEHRTNENLTECLSYSLVALLRANPELVAYLTK